MSLLFFLLQPYGLAVCDCGLLASAFPKMIKSANRFNRINLDWYYVSCDIKNFVALDSYAVF